MGLFDRKNCCVCGAKAGMLTRQKIANGEYICGDCRGKCSAQMNWRQFEAMNKEDVLAHMDYVIQNEEVYRNSFRETYSINTGILGGTRVVSVDEQNGWWVPAGNANPDILTFGEVISTRLTLDTRRLTEEERRDRSRARMPMPPFGMPGCSPDEEITGMKVIVAVNHPWLREVELNVLTAIFVTEGDIRAGYECAQEIISYFDQQAAAARYALQTAAVQSTQAASSSSDPIETLKKFKELLDLGAITQEEYNIKKKQLLNL